MKKIFYLLFISIILTSFVNATELTAYNQTAVLWVEVKDKPNNHKDWIGVYPKDASNSWGNVIAWKWARDGAASPDKPNTDEYRFFNIPDGDYDIRFFLNNTYKTEYKTSVSIFDVFRPSIKITNPTPAPNENISFNLSGILSDNKDWIGIYPKNASNDGNNVLTWSWAKNREVTLAGVPAGQYEARLFFNNSYKLEASVAFSVAPQSTLEIKSSAVETINTSSVNIFFNLNEKAQARVEYGETTNYGNFTNKETSFNYDSHRQQILGLNANTLYHYRVHAYDRNGVEVISNDKTFMIQQSGGYAYPPETAFQPLPTNNDVAQPETRGASVIDPEFGTTITRITDARIVDVNGKSCTGYTYPKIQSWNADMSLLKVSYKLYNADTLEESPITKGLTCDASYTKLGSPAGSAFRWSHKNPKVFYSLMSSTIFRKNTIDGNNVTHKTVIDFSEYGFEEMLLGKAEGNMSYDDKLVIFKAKKPGNDHVFAVLLNTETKRVIINERPNSSWGSVFVKIYQSNKYDKRDLYDWATISPKGDYILENKTKDGYLHVGRHYDKAPTSNIIRYDLNFKNAQIITERVGHGDIGIDSNGDQVWVQFEYGARSGTWSYNLDKLDDKLVGKKLLSNKGGHISCQNYNRRGWCYLSTTEDRKREVYALKLDGSGKVNRFAQTRYKRSSYGGVSPDGKRIVFQSDWNQGGKIDTYHVALKTNAADLNTNVLYDDAEDGNTNNWKVYDQTPAGATISNVFDADISNAFDEDNGSQVIKLQGSTTQNGYKLGGNWNNSERKSIQWKMKYDESFVVYISVNTSKGHRYIYYSPASEDRGLVGSKYIHHGLGASSIDATWRVFTRDLAADLKDYEDDNNLLSINGFLIRGSGLVDDIQLLQ